MVRRGGLDGVLRGEVVALGILDNVVNPLLEGEAVVPGDHVGSRLGGGGCGSREGDEGGQAESCKHEVDHFEDVGFLRVGCCIVCVDWKSLKGWKAGRLDECAVDAVELESDDGIMSIWKLLRRPSI